MALKCLNMVCEPHYKYLFNAQDNQLALPETETKKPNTKTWTNKTQKQISGKEEKLE